MTLPTKIVFTMLFAALVGCAGETGPAGDDGPRGEQGEPGPEGDPGDKGDPAERVVHRTTFTGEVRGEGLVDGRSLSFTKERDETMIRVTYYDAFFSIGYPGCTWALLFNGEECVQPASIGTGAVSGATIVGYCRGTSKGDLVAGPLTIAVTAALLDGSDEADDCRTGRADWSGMLEAEEVL
jgi:hypothetical protein